MKLQVNSLNCAHGISRTLVHRNNMLPEEMQEVTAKILFFIFALFILCIAHGRMGALV